MKTERKKIVLSLKRNPEVTIRRIRRKAINPRRKRFQSSKGHVISVVNMGIEPNIAHLKESILLVTSEQVIEVFLPTTQLKNCQELHSCQYQV